MVTAAIGLSLLTRMEVVNLESIYQMPTVYGAHVVGGLVFGVGFVMSGWCPGTAAVGLASGSGDALVFLAGTVAGSIVFNELYPVVRPLADAGNAGVSTVYGLLHLSRAALTVLLTAAAIVCFWAAEWVERRMAGPGHTGRETFLRWFSAALLVAALLPFLWSAKPEGRTGSATGTAAIAMLADVEAGNDHIEPEDLADRLLAGETDLAVFDLRPAAEFAAFHLRGARNVSLPDLAAAAAPHRNRGTIVLYSNGMTHPAQARDALFRAGFRNARLLTDGLDGFLERCLKPLSLRAEPADAATAARVRAWRAFFLAP